MADRNSQTPQVQLGAPKLAKRKWWQYLPWLKQGYEDQQAKYQEDYNYWMWKQQNEYNKPQSQVERYREAGLSTNLMYGQGGPGNAEQGPGAVRREESQGPQLGNVLGRFMDSKMKLAQIKDVESAAKLKDAQSSNLLKEISAKDSVYLDSKGLAPGAESMKHLSPRERSIYIQSQREIQKWSQDISNASSAKEQAEIMKKINQKKDALIIMQLVSGFGGVLGRFK